MDLDQLLQKHPPSRVATMDDEALLLDVIESVPMNLSGFELTYSRRPRFQKFLEYQASQFRTLIGVNGSGVTFSSFSWGPRFFSGQRGTGIYIGDFRSHGPLRKRVQWRVLYQNLVKYFYEASEFGPNRVVYTGVLKSNKLAFNSLVSKLRKHGLFYHLISEPVMVNCFGRKPHLRKIKSTLEIVSGDEVPEEELRKFLGKMHSQMYLGYCFDGSPSCEWQRRKSLWPEFSQSNFLVLLDKQKQILACTLPWSPGDAKTMSLSSISFGYSILLKFCKMLGLRSLSEGEKVGVLYLTLLTFDRSLSNSDRAKFVSQCLDQLISNKEAKDFHFISFGDFSNLRSEPSLRRYITQTTEVGVYVVSAHESAPEVGSPSNVNFEMGLA